MVRRRARPAERGGAQVAAVHEPAQSAHHAPHLRVHRTEPRHRQRQVYYALVFLFIESTA